MTWKTPFGDGNSPFSESEDATSDFAGPMTRLLEEIVALRMGKMTLSGEQMDFLVRLARLVGAGDYLEIGCFAGLNVLSMALRGPPGMRIRALDVNLTHGALARRHWREAGVDSRISLTTQSALLTLRDWRAAGIRERFDLILLDADKEPTARYFEHCLELLRPRGILAIDNVLLGGRTRGPSNPEDPPSVAVMAEFLERTRADPHLEVAELDLGDGMLLVGKVPPFADTGKEAPSFSSVALSALRS